MNGKTEGKQNNEAIRHMLTDSSNARSLFSNEGADLLALSASLVNKSGRATANDSHGPIVMSVLQQHQRSLMSHFAISLFVSFSAAAAAAA